MAKVSWLDELEGSPRASEATVREIENELGVRFPADYLAIAAIHQGASPEPYVVQLPNGKRTTFEQLLHFERSANPHTYIVAKVWLYLDRLPENVIPFARSSGDLWCFDFRDDPDNPPIVYWSIYFDENIQKVADTFTELVDKFEDE